MRRRLATLRPRSLRRALMPILVAGLVGGAIINVAFLATGHPGPGEQLRAMPGAVALIGMIVAILICASAYE